MNLGLRAPDSEGLRIRLATFEGPLDLLLHLIKRDEVDIYDIPIAHITHQYLETIRTMRLLDLEVAGEFLVMAATLMRIKARLLLPPSPLEEAGEEGDPREELVQRLLEYRKFKEVSLTLRGHEERRALVRPKGYTPRVESNEPLPLKPTSLFQLMDALRAVLHRMDDESVHEVVLPPVTVEERMEAVRAALRTAWGGQVRFAELVEDCRTRIEVIATFMALLELVRLGELAARQYEEFGEIWLFACEPDSAGAEQPEVPASENSNSEVHGSEAPEAKDEA
jgi:segregation and condensation protein A